MHSRLLALAAIAMPSLANAVPMTLDFTGTLSQYIVLDGASPPLDKLGTLSDLGATGSITWDLALAPAAVLTSTPAVHYDFTRGGAGTPHAEFISASVTWANGVFTPAPIPIPPGATTLGDTFFLRNDVAGLRDTFQVADVFVWDLPDGSRGFNGILFDSLQHFLSDATTFPTGSELPDFSTASTRVTFLDAVTSPAGGVGFAAVLNVTSVAVRSPVPVPEPSVWLLLLAGLGAAAVARNGVPRRRSARLSP